MNLETTKSKAPHTVLTLAEMAQFFFSSGTFTSNGTSAVSRASRLPKPSWPKTSTV